MKRVLRILTVNLLCVVLPAVVFGTTARIARAGALHTPMLPAWGRPADDVAAAAAGTTYQEWNAMSPTSTVPSQAIPLAAPTLVNPNASGDTQPFFYDSSTPGDGGFQAGTDIYSFSGVLTPVVVIPGYNLVGNQLSVSVEVQSFGGLIDTNDLTASYTDPEGKAHSILVSGLPSFSYSEAYNDGGSDNGFGTAYVVDNLWTFTLPQDTASLTLTWGWGVTSAAVQAVSVDTHSVPEPSSIVLGLMAATAIVWGKMGWRARQTSRLINR